MLPADLPLGTSHGDYAPRNILVGAHGEVTVLDTLGRWRAPIYSDLGNFLFAIKAGRAHGEFRLRRPASGHCQVEARFCTGLSPGRGARRRSWPLLFKVAAASGRSVGRAGIERPGQPARGDARRAEWEGLGGASRYLQQRCSRM